MPCRAVAGVLVGGAFSGLPAVMAMEAGWAVTEVGRQPWVAYNVMLTSPAATGALEPRLLQTS